MWLCVGYYSDCYCTVFRTRNGVHECNVFHLWEETNSRLCFSPPIHKNLAIWSHQGSREDERHGLRLAAMCCHEKVERRMHVWPSSSLYHKRRCRRKGKMMTEGPDYRRPCSKQRERAGPAALGEHLPHTLAEAVWGAHSCSHSSWEAEAGGWPQVWPRMTTAIYLAGLYSWFPVSRLIDRLLSIFPERRFLQGRHSHHLSVSLDLITLMVWMWNANPPPHPQAWFGSSLWCYSGKLWKP